MGAKFECDADVEGAVDMTSVEQRIVVGDKRMIRWGRRQVDALSCLGHLDSHVACQRPNGPSTSSPGVFPLCIS
jgi:hypothetical protein